MDFSVTQTFPAPVAEVLRLYADPDFLASLPPTAGLDTPRLLAHDVSGDVVLLRWQHRYVGDLPGGIQRFVDPGRLSWVEETTIDLLGATAKTSLQPDAYSELIRTSVSARFAGDAAGATRTIAGKVSVRLPLVGSKAERVIVGGLSDYLAEEALIANQRLA
jgi:uncharacterized protein YndB with AHSA1/START domain